MKNKNPLVSIYVFTYNSERFLKKTLNSIINQDYPNFEVIVSDNASIDDTEKIAKSFGSKVQFQRNPTNIGFHNSCNECLRVAKGEFAALYHSNDIYEPEIVRREVEFLQSHSEAGAVFTWDRLINENDNIIGEDPFPAEFREKEIYNFIDIYLSLLKNGATFLICPTFMARKSILEKISLPKEEVFRTATDTALWLKILENYPIGILKERLIKRRIEKSQGSYQYDYLRTERADYFFVIDAFLKSKSLDGVIVDKRTLRKYENRKRADDLYIARNLLMKGEIREARKMLLRSFSCDVLINSFVSIRELKFLLKRIILLAGISLGVGKPLLELLHKLRYLISVEKN